MEVEHGEDSYNYEEGETDRVASLFPIERHTPPLTLISGIGDIPHPLVHPDTHKGEGGGGEEVEGFFDTFSFKIHAQKDECDAVYDWGGEVVSHTIPSLGLNESIS